MWLNASSCDNVIKLIDISTIPEQTKYYHNPPPLPNTNLKAPSATTLKEKVNRELLCIEGMRPRKKKQEIDVSLSLLFISPLVFIPPPPVKIYSLFFLIGRLAGINRWRIYNFA